MRTRSQAASPGGFVSLESERTTRRNRSTRAASRDASAEPTSQQSAEPSTQPATRPKTQRTVKKTTTKKTASTTATAKTKTPKAPKCGTRKTTRKTRKAASEDASESIDENHLNTTGSDEEDNAELDTEEAKSGPSRSGTALLEPRSSEINRKRAHPETSPDSQAEPATPYANKRRNLGTPASAPFARHRTSLHRFTKNAVPYAERLQRRRTESQGRIHSTIFRLPEFVAQSEADRLASEASALTSPSTKPLQMHVDFSAEQVQTDDQVVSEHTSTTQESILEPSTPEPVKSNWNLRGILSSVPRSFSRLFGRSPESSETPGIQQPSSERIIRTRPSEAASSVAPERETQSRRRLSEQPPAKRPRNLSYSLFPAPIDRSLYLGDVFTKSPATVPTAPAPAPAPATDPVEQQVPQKPEPQLDSTSPPIRARGRDHTPQATQTTGESQKKKKRKRSPSPDVIPNPVGSSYGMDLDYFYYSSESGEEEEEEEEEEEAEPAPRTAPRKVDNLAKTAMQNVRNVAQSERPASKKVRFDASPEDTPSKRRARATDPYHGEQFVGFGGPQTSAPTTPSPVSRDSEEPQRPPDFIPNLSGTFQLNYDDSSDDSDSSSAGSPPSIPAPSPVSVTYPPPQPSTPQSAQLPTPRPTVRPAPPPSTPAKIDEEALARARSQAEKYKPKTPSGLRTTSRYSSPLIPTPDLTPAPPVEKITEKFGDDQFAEDAQWLYENCPSGDLRQLTWPAPQDLAESLNVSPEAVRVLNEIWDDSEVDNARNIFKREFEDFKKTLSQESV
ncbi:hypothetical protein BDW59DRAFT_136787 [Aspergillus cavernicola]|uniref:Structure-specific endonuclease subunit SLX4 n=1 Tax=Aspergillus cavernicola TaxID=176166 RepID=A0ABR4J4E1_9EURO